MATNSLPLIGKHHAVLTQLGDGEPETALEAAAFLEDIRTSKGYLDEETTSELEKISPRVRDKMLLMAHQRREMEAAFTTRSVLAAAVILKMLKDSLASLSRSIPPNTGSCMNSSRMPMTQHTALRTAHRCSLSSDLKFRRKLSW